MRRETQFLQSYSKIPPCENFSQKDSKVQRDKWISEVICHEIFSLSIFWKLSLIFLTTTSVTLMSIVLEQQTLALLWTVLPLKSSLTVVWATTATDNRENGKHIPEICLWVSYLLVSSYVELILLTLESKWSICDVLHCSWIKSGGKDAGFCSSLTNWICAFPEQMGREAGEQLHCTSSFSQGQTHLYSRAFLTDKTQGIRIQHAFMRLDWVYSWQVMIALWKQAHHFWSH